MMVHPALFDMLTAKVIAASMFEVHYTGKESHASAFPELGVNAADALTIAQTALGLLRPHIRSTDRIHGIVGSVLKVCWWLITLPPLVLSGSLPLKVTHFSKPLTTTTPQALIQSSRGFPMWFRIRFGSIDQKERLNVGILRRLKPQRFVLRLILSGDVILCPQYFL
jgi:hypothetical protein